MAALTAISSWFLLVALWTTGSLCADLDDEPNTCNTTHNDPSGTLHYSNASSSSVPENVKNCTWNIVSPTNNSIFLVFDHLYLMDGDEIRISANGKELDLFNPINLKNVVGALPCLTGEKNIMISLSTTQNKPMFQRTLVLHYYTNCTECSHTFEAVKAGTIRSPLYNPKSLTTPATVSLTVVTWNKLLHGFNLWFEKFMFSNGSVSVSGTELHDGKYNASNIPVMEFMADSSFQINVSLTNTTKDPELFVMKFDSINKICGGDMKVDKDKPVNIMSSSSLENLEYLAASNEQEVNCHWLVETDTGKTLSVATRNISLPGALSQFVILDGPNRTSPPLFDMNNQDNNQLRAIFSSGNYLWISASVPSVPNNFLINLQVSQQTSGGHMREKGQIKASGEDKTIFLLDASQGKQVQLVLSNASVLKDGGTVSFYKDFFSTSEPFLTMTAQNKMDIVESPTAQMAVVTSGFNTSRLDASFDGVDEGCFKYGDGSSGTFSVTGHCNSSCGWMVQPMPSHTGLFTFHFQSLSLSENDRVIIRMMDANQTQIANVTAPTSLLPDLWLPAATGAFVQVTRSDCSPNSTVIQSNYQTTPSCAATYMPKVGETVTISSPGYPNHYPLGDSCTWDVTNPNGSVFLHVSFSDLQLAKEDHVVEVYEVIQMKPTLLFQSNGTQKDMPNDMQVKGDLMVKFSAKAQMPLQSSPGFSLTVTAVGGGDDLHNMSGVVNTPSFPFPVNGSAFYVWLIDINSTENQKEIVEFSFSNTTDVTRLGDYLKIYDGASLRSQVIKNLSSTEKILSRTNQLLLVYQSSGSPAGLSFSLSYQNHSCNMSMLCDNLVCMHDDWHCNGINECGDFSDEKNCKGGIGPAPTPIPPTPSPPQPSGDGNKGVSTAALAVGILIALVIGAILGVGAPAAFKRLRGNRFQSYSSFTNNIE